GRGGGRGGLRGGRRGGRGVRRLRGGGGGGAGGGGGGRASPRRETIVSGGRVGIGRRFGEGTAEATGARGRAGVGGRDTAQRRHGGVRHSRERLARHVASQSADLARDRGDPSCGL